jgi:hypothetical protein
MFPQKAGDIFEDPAGIQMEAIAPVCVLWVEPGVATRKLECHIPLDTLFPTWMVRRAGSNDEPEPRTLFWLNHHNAKLAIMHTLEETYHVAA